MSNDPFEIPAFLDRRNDPVVKVEVPKRKWAKPKPYPAAKKKREVKALQKLGYPYSTANSYPPHIRRTIINEKIRYHDPLEFQKRLDAKVDEVVRTQKVNR